MLMLNRIAICFLNIVFYLSLGIFLALRTAIHVQHSYLEPQIQVLQWTDERYYSEVTYYARTCNEADITAKDAGSLFLDRDTDDADVAFDKYLQRGFVVFPDVLSRNTAHRLRQYVLEKNRVADPNPEGGNNFLHSPQHRWCVELGIEKNETDHRPSVVKDMLQEVANDPLFRSSLEKIIGLEPALIEMNAITSSYGAVMQEFHTDGSPDASPMLWARSFAPTHVMLMPLQDTTASMGATSVCPGTHFCSNLDDGKLYNEICEQSSFSIGDPDTGIWSAGTAVLMNPNAIHRGTAFTDSNATAIHRVVLVLTFAPRPQARAESRQLTGGLSYSLQWNLWGHTLSDLSSAHERIVWPLYFLRSMGIFKPRQSAWGWDFISVSLARIANGDDALLSVEEMEDFVKSGGIPWLPHFLNGNVENGDGWHDFLKKTLLRFHLSVGIATLLTATIRGIILVLSPKKKEPQSWWRRECCAMNELIFIPLTMVMFHCLVHKRIAGLSWSIDIQNKRVGYPKFAPDNSAWTRGLTTLPLRTDILIETRMGSNYLGMYNAFVQYHPGNRLSQQLITEQVVHHAVYKQLPGLFKEAVATFVVGHVRVNYNARFLYQNFGTGAWHVIRDADAVHYTAMMLDLEFAGKALQQTLQAIRSLENDCNFGHLRETALCSKHSPHFLHNLRNVLLNRTQFIVHSSGDPSPFPRPFMIRALCREYLKQKRPLMLRRQNLPISLGMIPSFKISSFTRSFDFEAGEEVVVKSKDDHQWYEAHVIESFSQMATATVQYDSNHHSFPNQSTIEEIRFDHICKIKDNFCIEAVDKEYRSANGDNKV